MDSTLSKDGMLSKADFLLELGNSRSSMSWDDICCGGTAFKQLFLDGYALERNKRARVDDFWEKRRGRLISCVVL